MAYSGGRTVAFLGELIALENRLSRGYGDGHRRAGRGRHRAAWLRATEAAGREAMILLSKFTVPIGWTVIFRRTGHQIYRGQCFGWAAALAYYSFLALFPALLLVVSIASFLPIQRLVDQVVEMVSRIAPGDVVAIVREQLLQITDKPHGRLLALSLVGTIWSMSSGMAALIGTLNQAQHISDGRSWWRIRATAIALTSALTLFMAVSFTLAMAGPTAAQHLANWLNLGASFAVSWQIVRWPRRACGQVRWWRWSGRTSTS